MSLHLDALLSFRLLIPHQPPADPTATPLPLGDAEAAGRDPPVITCGVYVCVCMGGCLVVFREVDRRDLSERPKP